MKLLKQESHSVEMPVMRHTKVCQVMDTITSAHLLHLSLAFMMAAGGKLSHKLHKTRIVSKDIVWRHFSNLPLQQ